MSGSATEDALRPPRLGQARVAPVLSLVLVLAFAALLWSLDPAGYRGGGGDDWHYLTAARCAVEHGYCRPDAHWGARFPLIGPMAASLALFGENRIALSLPTLLYTVAALSLFVLLVQQRFGRAAAALAGMTLAATPAVTQAFAIPNVDIVELCFLLAAALLLLWARRSDRPVLALLGGVMMALAIEARATALVAVPLAGLGFALMPGAARRLGPMFLLGLAAPLALEALAYLSATGDPFFSLKLSLGHSNLNSSELPAAARGRLPLFNVALIDGWQRTMDVHVHWTVDALLNLLVDPAICLTLIAPLVLLLLVRHRLATADLRLLLLMLAAGALYFGALVYALAIDPKPRMFLVVAAIGSAMFGVLASQAAGRVERAIAALLFAAIILNGFEQSHSRVDFSGPEALAPRWIAAGGGRLAVERNTAQILPMMPLLAALPRRPAAGIDHVLMIDEIDCDPHSAALGEGAWRIEKSRGFPLQEPSPLAALRRRKLILKPRPTPYLCQFERVRPVADIRR